MPLRPVPGVRPLRAPRARALPRPSAVGCVDEDDPYYRWYVAHRLVAHLSLEEGCECKLTRNYLVGEPRDAPSY